MSGQRTRDMIQSHMMTNIEKMVEDYFDHIYGRIWIKIDDDKKGGRCTD